MFDRNNFFRFLWASAGIILLSLTVIFVILPQINSSSTTSKSTSNFAKLMENKGSTTIPSKLKWGSDFNDGSKKINKKKNEENAFSHFKK